MLVSDYIKTVTYALSLANTPTWLFDVDRLRVVWANRAGLELWNAVSVRELQRRDMADGISRAVCERLDQYSEDLAGTTNTVSEHWTFYPKGLPYSCECSISAVQAPGLARWLLISATGCDRVSEPDTLYRSTALLHTSVCVSVFDRQGILKYRNPAARRLLGPATLSLAERFVDEQDWHTARDGLALAGQCVIEAQMVTARGTAWNNLTLEICPDPVSGVSSILVSETDVSDRREAQQLVYQLAYTDTLTGLPNRTSWLNTLAARLDGAHDTQLRLAVLFLDLDRFKLINDTLGHALGDQLLVAVAERLKGCIDDTHYLARLGGDEFTLLVEETTEAGTRSTRIARRLVEALAAPMQVDGHELLMTPSIGISLYPQHGTDANLLMRQADLAMYAAKETGNGFRMFKPYMTTQINKRLLIEKDLREAIDKAALQVHFQPKLRTGDGGLAGMEALIRWNHPTLGWIPPVDFIAVAEETGMIGEITRFVMYESMRQQIAWLAQGYDISVAINVSPVEFRRGNFASVVRKALQVTRCNPNQIELEITESMLMADTGAVQAILASLKSLGVKLSLDDFGTGYSNLGYLQKFPLDSIKIDRSFLSVGEISPVIELIIRVGNTLSLTVVAEGVETVEQRDFLIANGCDVLQGFLFSKPLDRQQADAYVRASRPEYEHWSRQAIEAA